MKKIYSLILVMLLIAASAALVMAQEREPNDNPSLAEKVTGNVINGNIALPGDEDWFYMERQEGSQKINFTISHSLPADDICLEIYDGKTLVARLANTKDRKDISCLVKTKKVYIKVKTWSRKATGTYQINIEPAA